MRAAVVDDVDAVIVEARKQKTNDIQCFLLFLDRLLLGVVVISHGISNSQNFKLLIDIVSFEHVLTSTNTPA
jgi:hypothetical protein